MATNRAEADDGDAPEDPEDLLPPTSVLSLDDYLDMQAAIGDRTRFAVVYTLVHAGDQSPKQLEDRLDVRGNTLHYHLNRLVEVGLVEKRKRAERDSEGLHTYYAATSLGEGILEHGVEELIRRERMYLDAYGDDAGTET